MNSSSNSSDSENPLPNRKIVIDSDTEIIPNIQARPSPVQSVQNDCERCKNLQYNAEHAWSVVRSATLKYSRNVELENENEQLNRINEEQAIYIEEQHNKIKELETTNNELSSANLNLEQRLEAMQSQYNMVVAKANEAKTHADAANEWRIKYESSQKTLLELHKSKKKTVDKYLAAVKLAKKLSENCDGSAKELSRMKEIVEPIEEELDEFRRTYKELFSYNKIFYKFLETRKNIERTQPVIKAIAGFLRIEETKKALLVSARRPRTRSRSLASCSMTPQENVNFDEISETGDVVDDGEEDLEETLERMLLENEQVPESINNSHEESYNISKEHIDADFIAPIISPKKHYSSKDQQNEPMSLIEKPISIDAANSQLQKHNTLSTNISVEEILNANFFKEMLQSPLISNIENTFQFSEISPESPLDTTKRKMLKSPLFPEPEPLISPLKKVNTERYKPVQDNDNSKDAQSPITESNLNSPTENYKTDTNQIKLKSILKSPISSQNEQRKTKSRVCIIDSDTNDEISEPQINENTVQRSDFLNKEHIEQDTRLFQLFQNASDKRRRLEDAQKEIHKVVSNDIQELNKNIDKSSQKKKRGRPRKIDQQKPVESNTKDQLTQNLVDTEIINKKQEDKLLKPNDLIYTKPSMQTLPQSLTKEISRLPSSSDNKFPGVLKTPPKNHETPSTMNIKYSSPKIKPSFLLNLTEKPIVSKQNLASVTSEEPPIKKGKTIRVLVPLKDEDYSKKPDLKSSILNTFDMVTNGRATLFEAHISFFKQNGPYLNTLSSTILADYMIYAMRLMNVGDLWPLIRSNILMTPETIEKEEFISNKERNFFAFALLLSQDERWPDLFQHFFRKLAIEILKSSESSLSLPQLSRNYRCLIVATKKLPNVEQIHHEILHTVQTIIKYLIQTKLPEVTIPIICFIALKDKNLVSSFLQASLEDPILCQLLRLHLSENHNGRIILFKIMACFNINISSMLTNEINEEDLTNCLHSTIQSIKKMTNELEITLTGIKVGSSLSDIIHSFNALLTSTRQFNHIKFSITADIIRELKSFFYKLFNIENELEEQRLFTHNKTKENYLFNLPIMEIKSFSNLLFLLARIISSIILNISETERHEYISNLVQEFVVKIYDYRELIKMISENSQAENIVLFVIEDFLKVVQPYTLHRVI